MSNFKSPSIRVGVNKGKTYYWCGCGLSKKQPFCDGSHKEDKQGRKPITYTALADKFISFCTCKETQLPPICDGSHRNIRAEESDNSDDNKINSNILKLKVIID